jgi:hypothetical protein
VVCRRKKEFENYKDEDLEDKKPEEYLDNSTGIISIIQSILANFAGFLRVTKPLSLAR